MTLDSATATSRAEPPSPYPRDNWWFEETGHPGHSDSRTETQDRNEADAKESRGPHVERPGTSRAEWIAHRVLKATAPLICPVTANVDPDDEFALHKANQHVELTDPELYVESSEVDVGDGGRRRKMYGDHRRHRYNPVYGYITGPQIADQPTEQFMQIVDIILELGMLNEGLRDKTADRIWTLARSQKQSGVDDVSIMAEVVRCIESPGMLTEKGF